MLRSMISRMVIGYLALIGSAIAADLPRSCPASPGIVVRSVGPAVQYLGVSSTDPSICIEQRGPDRAAFCEAVWDLTWPGAPEDCDALKRVIAGPPGTSVTFNTVAAPGLQWHGTFRNQGIEMLRLNDGVHKTLHLSHEREGFGGNTYHSVIDLWKEFDTGMIVYQTYRHISGHPEPGGAWDPLIIMGGH